MLHTTNPVIKQKSVLFTLAEEFNNVSKACKVIGALRYIFYRYGKLADKGGVDLSSPAGKMTMQVISAVAEFERDLLLERTYSGIARAKASGKRFGRPPVLNEEQRIKVIARIDAGISISAIAREFNTTRQTILRVKARQQ